MYWPLLTLTFALSFSLSVQYSEDTQEAEILFAYQEEEEKNI